MFQHLLVPLDGSSLAEKALPLVQALATRFGSRVTLLRVAEPVFVPSTEGDGLYVQFVVSLQEEAARQAQLYLDEMEAALAGETAVSTIVCDNITAADAILSTAANIGADTIVMSTHGHGGLRRLVYGSVASKVLTHSPIPILLVRAQEELDLTLPAIEDVTAMRAHEEVEAVG